MKKYGKPGTLAFIDNYNFDDRQTDGHGDSMTNPAWRAESVKITLKNMSYFKV